MLGTTPKPRKTTPLQTERVQYVQGGKQGSKGMSSPEPNVNIDAGAPVAQASKKQRKDAIPDGMTKVDIAKDGNCLFASIAMVSYNGSSTKGCSADSCSMHWEMQRHPRSLETSWDGLVPTSGEKPTEAETGKLPLCVYLDMLAKEGLGKVLSKQRLLHWLSSGLLLCSGPLYSRLSPLFTTETLKAIRWCFGLRAGIMTCCQALYLGTFFKQRSRASGRDSVAVGMPGTIFPRSLASFPLGMVGQSPTRLRNVRDHGFVWKSRGSALDVYIGARFLKPLAGPWRLEGLGGD